MENSKFIDNFIPSKSPKNILTFTSSVGSNLVRFGGSFSFLRFGRFEVRFLGPKKRFSRFEVRF